MAKGAEIDKNEEQKVQSLGEDEMQKKKSRKRKKLR